jgi:hypothetical protein
LENAALLGAILLATTHFIARYDGIILKPPTKKKLYLKVNLLERVKRVKKIVNFEKN